MKVEFAFSVPKNHPALPGHFPDRPIVPGVLLLDRVISALETTVGRPIVHLDQIKFISALSPGETAQVECDIDDARVTMRVDTSHNGVVRAVASGSMRLAAHATKSS